MFETLEAPGADDCPRCGAKPYACGSAGAHGQPYYFVRCDCGIAGPSGPDLKWAVNFWNQQEVYKWSQEKKHGKVDSGGASEKGSLHKESEGSGNVGGEVRIEGEQAGKQDVNENETSSGSGKNTR
jgi:hypothetical protein